MTDPEVHYILMQAFGWPGDAPVLGTCMRPLEKDMEG